MEHVNYNIKLNLAAYKHVITKLKRKDGSEVEGVFIPLTENHVFRGEKGLWSDLTAIVVKAPKFDDTHIVKQSLPKEVYEALTADEKTATPIFGNMGPWKTNSNVAEVNEHDPELDDLPF